MKDSLFKNVEKKTNINKDTIMSLAKKLQSSNFKDEKVLNEVIDELSSLTGKNIDDSKRDKIKTFLLWISPKLYNFLIRKNKNI